MNQGFAKNPIQKEHQIANFFYQELREQEYSDDDCIDWDDYAQGATDLESYDPWSAYQDNSKGGVELYSLSPPRVVVYGLSKLFHNAVEKAVEK